MIPFFEHNLLFRMSFEFIGGALDSKTPTRRQRKKAVKTDETQCFPIGDPIGSPSVPLNSLPSTPFQSSSSAQSSSGQSSSDQSSSGLSSSGQSSSGQPLPSAAVSSPDPSPYAFSPGIESATLIVPDVVVSHEQSRFVPLGLLRLPLSCNSMSYLPVLASSPDSSPSRDVPSLVVSSLSPQVRAIAEAISSLIRSCSPLPTDDSRTSSFFVYITNTEIVDDEFTCTVKVGPRFLEHRSFTRALSQLLPPLRTVVPLCLPDSSFVGDSALILTRLSSDPQNRLEKLFSFMSSFLTSCFKVYRHKQGQLSPCSPADLLAADPYHLHAMISLFFEALGYSLAPILCSPDTFFARLFTSGTTATYIGQLVSTYKQTFNLLMLDGLPHLDVISSLSLQAALSTASRYVVRKGDSLFALFPASPSSSVYYDEKTFPLSDTQRSSLAAVVVAASHSFCARRYLPVLAADADQAFAALYPPSRASLGNFPLSPLESFLYFRSLVPFLPHSDLNKRI